MTKAGRVRERRGHDPPETYRVVDSNHCWCALLSIAELVGHQADDQPHPKWRLGGGFVVGRGLACGEGRPGQAGVRRDAMAAVIPFLS